MNPNDKAGVDGTNMNGITVVVTGATSGIGRETAISFSRLGADVHVHGRDENRGEEVANITNGTFHRADFASFEEVRNLASSLPQNIDILVNNAGGYFTNKSDGGDGLNYTMKVNHLSPFLLTKLLLEKLGSTGRVTTVASVAHKQGKMDLQNLTDTNLSGWKIYAQSKLANIQFTKELEQRESVEANCLHPGNIPDSKFFRSVPRVFAGLFKRLTFLPFLQTKEYGAANVLYSAIRGAGEGEYISGLEESQPNARAKNKKVRQRLWSKSEEMTGLSESTKPS